MTVTAHQPESREKARGYSEATSGQGIIAVAGQLPGSDVLERGAPFHEQFVSALERLIEALASAGATPADLLVLRIYVTNVAKYKDETKLFGSAYRDALGGQYPATTLVEVSALIDDRAMVEMEALAVQP
jgi:enamine deaminase RidA (YjgF/YER057c/UK114 family)